MTEFLENTFLGTFMVTGFILGRIWRTVLLCWFTLYDFPLVHLIRLAFKDGFGKGIARKLKTADQPTPLQASGFTPAPGHQGEPGPANTYVYSEPALSATLNRDDTSR